MQSDTQGSAYPVQLSVGYPDRDLDRATTVFRLIWAIPIAILVATIRGGPAAWETHGQGTSVALSGTALLFVPPLLMIVFRQKYPRWWFDSRDVARETAIAYSTAQQLIVTGWNVGLATLLVVLVFGWTAASCWSAAPTRMPSRRSPSRNSGARRRGGGGACSQRRSGWLPGFRLRAERPGSPTSCRCLRQRRRLRGSRRSRCLRPGCFRFGSTSGCGSRPRRSGSSALAVSSGRSR